ncbi:MAG: BREX-1 system phosphatase PglZ type A [Methylobacter sp.]|nr:BREX-1 system phosphatase PglZ type A [Methylobacter sp.]MDP2429599.1 BREX-1 system phosphatase PglZ type A [Methylobacter sp.]MDP3056008.1 BREX-1 system phosphatase PglZ type A [Methylobacter sp.]MDP3363628.1 BREX-1 system phosphatase PglZ type A [Methylobacter sp.]MDZ4217421.1 BREX-1 system phosphatase PglZ type A [Methylobacter sp.]
MDITQLQQGIEAKFAIGSSKECRLLFWYDPEKSFHEVLSSIVVPGVTVLDMSGLSIFETKKRIELDEPKNRFLLYFPYSEPVPDKDWFLDIRLYSEQFYADASSMLLNELGIQKMSLRTHIRNRQDFFGSKQRITALKRFITENEDERSLDRKMLAVIVKSDSASISDIILSLLKDYAVGLGTDELPLVETITKFDLDKSLWSSLAEEYGYEAKEPSLADFALKLFCTELWSQIDGADQDWLLNNVMKSSSGRATALAFMAGWRDSRTYAQYHDTISTMLGKKLEVADKCAHYQPNQIVECVSFEVVEQAIIRGLVSDLLDPGKLLDRSLFETILSRRLVGHWCLSRKEYTAIYEAMRNAELLMYLRQRFVDGFHYNSSKEMYDAYVADLYQFDKAYRLFNEHVQALVNIGSEILRKLDEAVESLYTNWYLYELGLAWDRHLDKEQRIDNWQLSRITLQYKFYEERVKPLITSKQLKRIFVIISDAMRYEIAEELTDIINGEKRFKAELSSQLGVLPSYTQLGMAALLPHKTLEYQAGSTTVLVDGQSTAGLDNRSSVLEKFNGMAVSAKDLMGWRNQEGREKIRDCQTVYIYHDTIDFICDKQAGEDRTPQVCRTAIVELTDLIGRIINRLNGSQILLTSDHGFLFQQKALDKPDKTELSMKPNGAIEAKKRYIVGENLPTDDSYWKGKVANTAGASGETEFMVPKGAQRFHFVGGAKFVHGGAMLQEICIPVVYIKGLKKEQAAQHEKQKVGVVVSRLPIKLVNNIDKIKFIQADPVGEGFISRQLDVYIVDSDGSVVSSRETMNFDSSSKVMDERTREARLKLIGSLFDRHAAYTLVLEECETQTRYQQYSVTIDLAIQDDFF